ncbi:uroporphyrinogen-III synthase [Paracoccus benzoatiresistens]|uniref:Uroporphyrinogen-III synthase n=1 Tax=Paracoccus benzoatiresistens TaxID=2997341 RepID=A0ABT4J180_9RHOB|nr:uroporphyrinogen-III synthase [Paracoccus sp. EF6]MCZ0960380.1 uroporphyrinogen-III synthase [Paracoccus sp. EF6]
MSSAKPPALLLTRPLADSQRFAAMLPDWPAVISPILRIVPVDHDSRPLQDAPGLVFTSAHAVASAGPGRGRLALCVGGHTARVAQAAGFDVREGNGFAEGLLPLIAAAGVPLIHPHGRHLARELPVAGVVVYDQQPLPLSDDAQALLAGGAPVVLPLFSPRSARLVADAARAARAPLWPVAISTAAMAAWDAPAAGRRVADSPDAAAMVDAIRSLSLAEP